MLEKNNEYYEEGDKCPKCNKGILVLEETRNCSCHISPPCGACEDRKTECPLCGWKENKQEVEEEVEVEHVFIYDLVEHQADIEVIGNVHEGVRE